MNKDLFVQHIPAIEEAIRAGKLDTIVCGMGPTAWLLPWIDQSLLSGLRIWGCHDACAIMPMDDLVIMDGPTYQLHPAMRRFDDVVKARPKRLWLYEPNMRYWNGAIPKCMAGITRPINFSVCRPDRVPRGIKFKLVADPLHTTSVSPTGTTALAWREGGRRIGVIGVDMQKGMHHTYKWWQLVDYYFTCVAEEAKSLGGAIVNLSPITSLRNFRDKWTPSASSLVPISGSVTPEPNSSSNTPSESTPPATSTSSGCAREIQSGPSASTATLAHGSSAGQ